MAALSCTGAILVGGKSSRMQQSGVPKHELVLPDGRTMLDHVVASLSRVCPKILLIGSSLDHTIDGFACVTDLRPHAGPLGGIEALLASGIDSHYIVCPCDVPLISSDLLKQLLQSPESLATVFQVDGRNSIDPLPARIRAEVLPAVRRLLNAQQRSVWKLMKEIAPCVARTSSQQAIQLHNVNTRRDFDAAVKRLAALGSDTQ